MPTKVLFVLVDGIGDVALASKQWKTPLQVAQVPHLDLLAAHGLNGVMDPVEPGLACGSDTAHLSILGYDPQIYYRGRGAFESMGAGLSMQAGDVAFKSNFATWDPRTRVVMRRRCDRAFHEWGPPLCAALTGIKLRSFPDIKVDVKYATEHRCGVRLRGPGLSDFITGTDPLKDGRELVVCAPTQDMPEAHRTSRIVNELSEQIHKTLEAHPLNVQRREQGLHVANLVLLRGCGARIEVPSFEERHGMRGFVIAPTAIIAGLGISLGMDRVHAPGATGDYRTDLLSKGRVAVDTLCKGSSKHEFGFLHIKAVDDAGHDRDEALKIHFLQQVDRMLAQVLPALQQARANNGDEYLVVVTGDHSTPVLHGDHSCEPVPFVVCNVADLPLCDKGAQSSSSSSSSSSAAATPSSSAMAEMLRADRAQQFDEQSACVGGALGQFPGREVMPLINRLRAVVDTAAIEARTAAATRNQSGEPGLNKL